MTSLFGGTGCGLSYSLTGLYVQPGTGLTCVFPTATAQYNAYGTYTEGGHTARIEDITDQVTWSVNLATLATISPSGLATALNNGFTGTTGVVATTNGEFGNLTAYSSLQVSNSCGVTPAIARPFSLHIVAGDPTVPVGNTLQPLAIATYPDTGRTADLSGQVTWSSSDSKVATVDARGVIAAVAPGDAVITATAKTPNGEVVSTTQTVHSVANTQ